MCADGSVLYQIPQCCSLQAVFGAIQVHNDNYDLYYDGQPLLFFPTCKFAVSSCFKSHSLSSNLTCTHKHFLLNANINPCCCLKVEKLARTLFLWKIEVHEQKEKVYEMRRWNEALVTNMLPEHVARHFLGSKKRDEVTLFSFIYIYMCLESVRNCKESWYVYL